MKKILLSEELDLEDIMKEYKLCYKLKHKNIVQILGVYNNKLDITTFGIYILMEIGLTDWEKEIKNRCQKNKMYSQKELINILTQLTNALSFLQEKNVSHRDIKPQNVLFINGLYKLCDFGEARIIDGSGLIQQRVRGSQLFMSPILFYAYNRNISLVMHNSYKSDVFSLGMCALLAASLSVYALYDIRELFDINAIANIINNRLKNRYSVNLINLIIKMLQIDENLRMDFIGLESFLLNFWRN